jgi:hypothetical protein
VKGGKLVADARRRLSAPQRRTLEALAVDGAQIMPHTSAIWPVKLGARVLTMVRWVTIEALANAGYISQPGHAGAYRITDAGRAALAKGTKENSTV